jgi:hypothetical protein
MQRTPGGEGESLGAKRIKIDYILIFRTLSYFLGFQEGRKPKFHFPGSCTWREYPGKWNGKKLF